MVSVFLMIGLVVIGIVGWAWRINLAINHPKKEARLRSLGAHIQKEQEEVARTLGAGGKKALGIGMKIARRYLEE